MKEKKPEEGRKYANRNQTMGMTPAQLLYRFIGSEESNAFSMTKTQHEKMLCFFVGLYRLSFSIHCTRDKCIWPFFTKQNKNLFRISLTVNRHLCIERSWTIGDESQVTTPSITHIEHRFGNDKYSSEISPVFGHSSSKKPVLFRLWTMLFDAHGCAALNSNKTKSIYHILQITGKKMSSFSRIIRFSIFPIVYDRRLCR